MTDVSTRVTTVTVRYFGAARAAAGTESETVGIGYGATILDLADLLARRHRGLAAVLQRCSYLRDGVAARDLATPLHGSQTVDVLPPFAGG